MNWLAKPQRVAGIALVLALSLDLLAPSPGLAGGRRPVLPGGSSLQPGETTPIQLASEVVTITLRAATLSDNAVVKLNPQSYFLAVDQPWFTLVGEVSADFTLKNPTSQALEVSAWFPLCTALDQGTWQLVPGEIVPTIVDLQVRVNDEPIMPTFSEQPNPHGTQYAALPRASFPLRVPAMGATHLHLSYSFASSETGSGALLYYDFQPGAGWAGPVGKAELVVNLPYPASDQTVAGIQPTRLFLPPYYNLQDRAGLPSGAVLSGSQLHWSWANIEPGLRDNLALILLRPGDWLELEAGRTAVLNNPGDGRAWLDLGARYLFVAGTDHYAHSLFFPVYQPLSRAAYEQAATYLPTHPGSHAGLALLSLLPFLKNKAAPPEVLALVESEYALAQQLEAQNPVLAGEKPVTRSLLHLAREAIFTYYDYYSATSVAEEATQTAAPFAATTFWADRTLTATALGTAPLPASETPTMAASPTWTPTATPTRTPSPKATATTSATPSLALSSPTSSPPSASPTVTMPPVLTSTSDGLESQLAGIALLALAALLVLVLTARYLLRGGRPAA